jgi:hypothetical protein
VGVECELDERGIAGGVRFESFGTESVREGRLSSGRFGA